MEFVFGVQMFAFHDQELYEKYTNFARSVYEASHLARVRLQREEDEREEDVLWFWVRFDFYPFESDSLWAVPAQLLYHELMEFVKEVGKQCACYPEPCQRYLVSCNVEDYNV